MIIILMFICICNAITEKQVKAAVAAGAHTLRQLQAELGVASCCGCCAETATDYLPGGRYAAHQTVHVLDDRVAPAANDGALPARFTEVIARRA